MKKKDLHLYQGLNYHVLIIVMGMEIVISKQENVYVFQDMDILIALKKYVIKIVQDMGLVWKGVVNVMKDGQDLYVTFNYYNALMIVQVIRDMVYVTF